MAKKSIEQRLKELSNSINAIAFSFDNYMRDGNDMHLLTIKTQLRALIATGGRNMKPLLLELAEKQNIDLYIYSSPNFEKPSDIDFSDISNVIVDFPLSKTWSTKLLEDYNKFTFREWLQYPAYSGLYTNGYVSRNKILREIADSGGSHFDEDIKELVNYIDDVIVPIIGLHGQVISSSGLSLFLLDIAAATCWMGNRFLYKVEKKFSEIKNLDEKFEEIQLGSITAKRMGLILKLVPNTQQPKGQTL